jgi:hypothetical protein
MRAVPRERAAVVTRMSIGGGTGIGLAAQL